MRLRVHGITHDSHVNGPGRRSVLHLQGCTLGCAGCFNPTTHPHAGGELVDVDELAARLLHSKPEGLTISGGEPFQQADGVAALISRMRQHVDSVLIFTGYSQDELMEMDAPLAGVDVLVAGRYDATAPVGEGLLSSANQRLHLLTDRHFPDEVELDMGQVEIQIHPDGRVSMTGFPTPALARMVRKL